MLQENWMSISLMKTDLEITKYVSDDDDDGKYERSNI